MKIEWLNLIRVRRARLALLVLLLCLTGGLLITSAQQTQDIKRQQRARRVEGQKPPPTPTPTQPGEEVDEGDVVRVETQLVSVPAMVTDSTGRPLTNLSAQNFLLFEDGKPQQISNFTTTEAPFEVALLLDTSGSTRSDVDLIRRAAQSFIESLREGDRVALVSFNTGSQQLATVEVKAKLTSDRAVLRKALGNLGASNGTPFYDALARIAKEVFRDPPGDEVRGRRAIVALTDGVDSSSNTDYQDARLRLLRLGVACYFIQVNTEEFVENRLMKDCEDEGALQLSRKQLERYRKIFLSRNDDGDASFCQLGPFERMQISRSLYAQARQEMNDLARASGGRTFPTSDLRDARAAFAQVAREIGTQYSLGYYPTNKTRDGKFRAIKVEVRGIAGGVKVRAREGYYAPRG